MTPSLCERVAAPLLELHRRTTPVAAVVILGCVALGVFGYGIASENYHVAWLGVLVTTIAWYGFLLSGCERLLAAKERELAALRQIMTKENRPDS